MRNISWVTVQTVIAIMIICSIVILKELTPDFFNTLKKDYQNIIEKSLMIHDDEYKIIDEE